MVNDSSAIYHQTDLPVFDEALNDHDYAYHTNLSEYVSHVRYCYQTQDERQSMFAISG
jgi:hypothetical protein